MNTMRAGPGHGDDGILQSGQAGATAARMLAGARLRRLREAAGLSRERAGYAIRASESKISRLELGRTGLKQRDVADLLSLYGVDDQAERATLLELARRASAPPWWHRYAVVVPAWFEPYLGLEPDASLIRSYEVQFIPGLLQTEDYARAVIRLDPAGPGGEHIEKRVSLRMRRQQILNRPRPPQLWAVIDEAALRRPIGGPAVMRAQLRHLTHAARLAHVKIQILPLNAGGHAASGGPVTLLRFPCDSLPDMVYLEQLTTAVYPARPAELVYYWNVLNRLATGAEPPAATAAILQQILGQTWSQTAASAPHR